jgi:hypothetical protein
MMALFFTTVSSGITTQVQPLAATGRDDSNRDAMAVSYLRDAPHGQALG